MIVDDEKPLLRALSRALDASFHIETFSDANTALDTLRSGRDYNAILCDINLPGLTGLGLLDEVIMVRPDLADRFVFMSGRVWHGNAIRARGLSMSVLAKPFTPADLIAALDQVMSRSSSY